MSPDDVLSAMSARDIPAGSGLFWDIYKMQISETVPYTGRYGEFVQPGVYTFLRRIMVGSANIEANGATVVMEDTEPELRTHLPFVLQAQGKVLVSGLGLGCVVRGLLARPEVESVTVLEISPEVLGLVGPYMPLTDRLEIIHADALQWTKQTERRFDCAWHDIWTDKSEGEDSLAMAHTRLMFSCIGKITKQGAWDFPPIARAALLSKAFPWIGPT